LTNSKTEVSAYLEQKLSWWRREGKGWPPSWHPFHPRSSTGSANKKVCAHVLSV